MAGTLQKHPHNFCILLSNPYKKCSFYIKLKFDTSQGETTAWTWRAPDAHTTSFAGKNPAEILLPVVAGAWHKESSDLSGR